MPQIFVTDRKGTESPVEATDGFTLMEVIRDEGKFELAAICGGMLSCSTCHVYVAEDWVDRLEPKSRDERELLEESAHYQDNSRLSCQIHIKAALAGLKVTVAPED